MKTTWDRNDGLTRYSLLAGFLLLVAGICVAAYCGYTEQYEHEKAPDILWISGWTMVVAGIVCHGIGLFLSPFRRR